MKKWMQFTSGVAAGVLLCAAFTATARAGSGLTALPVSQQVTVNGQQVEMDGFLIADSNYVKLRDVGELLDVNVYWEDGVYIDTTASYTGLPPEEETRTPLAALPAGETDADTVREEIIRLTNALREENGLPALSQDEKLMEAAQVRAEEMAATGVYSHVRPDGTKRSTVTDCPYTTENIHRISVQRAPEGGKTLAETAVADWAASQVHLEAMLDGKRSSTGVGVAKGVDPATGRESWYCVQWFLRTGYSVTWVDEPALKN